MGKYNFEDYRVRVKRKKLPVRIPITSRSYNRYGNNYNEPVAANDFTLEEIYEIIRSGDVEACRDLSRYFYRTNGEYKNNVDFLAHLPLYDNVIIPVYQEGQVSEVQSIKAFYNACEFVDKLDLKNNLVRITLIWVRDGVY